MEKWEAVGEREASPFQMLGSTADYAIEKAETTQEGSKLEVLTAMLMAPLMVEAALNHIAAGLFKADGRPTALWEMVERASPKDKLRAICEHIGFEVNSSIPPFQHFGPMFKFRNLIAHGKTEIIRGKAVYDGEEHFSIYRSPEFMPAWERECTIENARRYGDAARDIALTLCKASDVKYPINRMQWSGSPVQRGVGDTGSPGSQAE